MLISFGANSICDSEALSENVEFFRSFLTINCERRLRPSRHSSKYARIKMWLNSVELGGLQTVSIELSMDVGLKIDISNF